MPLEQVRVRVPLISVRAMGDGGDAAGRAEAGEADDVAGQVEDVSSVMNCVRERSCEQFAFMAPFLNKRNVAAH